MSLFVDMEKWLGDFHLKTHVEVGEETLALLGASGSGKSMTLQCVAGIRRPDRGKIVLDGETLFDSEKGIDLPPQRRRVGYLFQNYALFPNMTVEKNIRCGLREKRDAPMVEELIEAMGLKGLEHKRPYQLSGGEQQRTALARILVSRPRLLLLDEPFSALDSHLRFQMERETRQVIHRLGKTALLVSHDRDEVFRLAQQVAVMRAGQILQMGTRHQVFQRPETVSAARLTGCKNISRAKALGEGKIEALDWGVTLCLPQGAEAADYVGVRLHDVVLGLGENQVVCRVAEVVEDPFSVTVMLKPLNAGESEPFGIVLDKEAWKRTEGEALTVSLPPEALLLLKE